MTTSRRSFLRALGAAAAVPFVQRLLPQVARAADAPPPKRMVVFYTGQGHIIDQFVPSGGASLGPALEPLAALRGKIDVLHNIEGTHGHYEGHAESLTGRPNGETFTASGGPSLDQIIAERNRGQTILPSLELGVYAGSGADGMIAYSAAGLPIPCAGDPRGVFDRMFRTLNQDPAVAARRRAQDRSVLDAIAKDYGDIQGGLGVAARRLLDAHLTLVRAQEQALLQPVEVKACDLGTAPTAPSGEDGYDYPTTARLQMNNAVAALSCDVTRVVTIMLGYAQNTITHRWLGQTDDFHQIAHGSVADSAGKFLAVDRWQAGELAHMLGGLDTAGILDSSAVVWISELGLHQFDHLKGNAGVVLAGSAGGFLKTAGRTVDMGGAHYHDVLLTLGHAMGATNLTSFGEHGTQVLSQLH